MAARPRVSRSEGGVGGRLGRIRQPVGRGEVGVRQAHPCCGGVQARDEGGQARTVGVRERIRRVGSRRQQQGLQQLLRGQHVTGAKRRALPAVLPDVGERRLRHPDLLVQVPAFEDDKGGHHLGDAGHGSLGVHPAAPQHLAGSRVSQDRALGLHALRRAGHLDQRPSGRVAGPGPGRRHRGPADECRAGSARRPGARSGVRDRPRRDAAADDGGSPDNRNDPSRQPHSVVYSRHRRSAGWSAPTSRGRRRRAATLYRQPGSPGRDRGLARLLVFIT